MGGNSVFNHYTILVFYCHYALRCSLMNYNIYDSSLQTGRTIAPSLLGMLSHHCSRHICPSHCHAGNVFARCVIAAPYCIVAVVFAARVVQVFPVGTIGIRLSLTWRCFCSSLSAMSRIWSPGSTCFLNVVLVVLRSLRPCSVTSS
jgi:hypothetical protein